MELEDLEPFVGTWDMEAVFPADWDAPAPDGEITTTFEWVLDGRFLEQRAAAPSPIPQGRCLIGADGSGAFTQHYFDSHGVARVYAMTFDGTTWVLERTTPDFSPLDFQQRYTGTLSDGGSEIRGAWEICHDGTTWQQDFELHYRRRS